MKKEIIPIFYSTDDRFVRYTVVSLKSLIENANPKREYVIHILNAGLSNENQALLSELNNKQFEIVFSDVRDHLAELSSLLSVTTTPRLLITVSSLPKCSLIIRKPFILIVTPSC